jgi:flagellar basal-body rod protein FlgB
MRTLFTSIDQLGEALSFHRDRHGVLSGNLANLDTPGYQPLDLARKSPPAPAEAAIEPMRTDPLHLAPPPASTSLETFADPSPSPGGDGNGVNLEREMAKIGANRVRYAATTELVTRRLALLRYGAGDGS